ncbi:MAG: DNA replication/repair protein RecF [Bdellovibrionota bacterium]
MIVDKLYLYQFRNLKDQNINFSNKINLIYGNNGEGKTNLLEALYILSITKSFRPAKTEDFISFPNNEASVFADIKDGDITKNIGVSFFRNQGRKLFIEHQEEKSLNNFIRNLICISFSPNDLLMVRGASELRRRFLDKHISDYEPLYLNYLLQYKKALRNKIILIKQGASQKEVIPWNKILAECGFFIQQKRVEFLRNLEDKAKDIYSTIAPHDGKLNLVLKNNFKNEVSKEGLFNRYNSYLRQELMFKRVLVGVHRDDLLMFLGDRESKKYSSQGQVRSIVLSLKLGVLKLLEEVLKESPIVLLDDVDSELDDKRREMLVATIFNQTEQVFISGVNKNILDFLEQKDISKVFHISCGKLTEAC